MKKSLLTLTLGAAALCAGATDYTGTVIAEIGENTLESAAVVSIDADGDNYKVTIGEFPTEILGMTVAIGPVVYENVTKSESTYTGSLSGAKIASIPRIGAITLTEVDLTVTETGNDINLKSTGTCSIGGGPADVNITFTGQAGATLAEGVYFADDFEWLAPWGTYTNKDGKKIGDTVGTDDLDVYCAFNDTPKVDGVSVKDAMEAKGYGFLLAQTGKTDDEAGNSVYFQTYYFKFGKSGFQSGIKLPAVAGIPADAEVAVSFDWCPMRQGSGTMDPTKLIVVVTNGEEVTKFDVPEHGLESGSALRWIPATVKLEGVTVNENTSIAIRPEDAQWSVTGQHRWFIDNIKVGKHDVLAGVGSVATDTVDENAPVEYYNIQGMRVNSDNLPAGLYIRRQGNKATKILVR